MKRHATIFQDNHFDMTLLKTKAFDPLGYVRCGDIGKISDEINKDVEKIDFKTILNKLKTLEILIRENYPDYFFEKEVDEYEENLEIAKDSIINTYEKIEDICIKFDEMNGLIYDKLRFI